MPAGRLARYSRARGFNLNEKLTKQIELFGGAVKTLRDLAARGSRGASSTDVSDLCRAPAADFPRPPVIAGDGRDGGDRKRRAAVYTAPT
jgi:hypothetical protein